MTFAGCVLQPKYRISAKNPHNPVLQQRYELSLILHSYQKVIKQLEILVFHPHSELFLLCYY